MSPQRMSDALLLRKEREENALPFSRSPFVDRLQTRPREPSAEEVSTEKGDWGSSCLPLLTAGTR